MPNGESSWVGQLRDRDEFMTTLKNIGTIAALVLAIGGPLSAYWIGRMQTEEKFAQQAISQQVMHEEIMLELTKVKQHILYTEDGLEDLSEQIPFYFQLHEAKMHPKEFASKSSPTPVVIALPKKPDSELSFKE
jgi:hypothetical protein